MKRWIWFLGKPEISLLFCQFNHFIWKFSKSSVKIYHQINWIIMFFFTSENIILSLNNFMSLSKCLILFIDSLIKDIKLNLCKAVMKKKQLSYQKIVYSSLRTILTIRNAFFFEKSHFQLRRKIYHEKLFACQKIVPCLSWFKCGYNLD